MKSESHSLARKSAYIRAIRALMRSAVSRSVLTTISKGVDPKDQHNHGREAAHDPTGSHQCSGSRNVAPIGANAEPQLGIPARMNSSSSSTKSGGAPSIPGMSPT